MAAAETLKLCLVGPQECGKTYLARLLGGQVRDPAPLSPHPRPPSPLPPSPRGPG